MDDVPRNLQNGAAAIVALEDPAGKPGAPREPRLRVAVTGSHGLIGTALSALLRSEGHTVIRVVRGRPGPGDLLWDPERGQIDAEGLEAMDAVVHLAGENLASGRWTAQRKRRLAESRTVGTSLLASTLARLDAPPGVLVSASAVGYYGDRGDEILTEASPPGSGFLARLSQAWEEAADPAGAAGIRVVHPRFGVVLSPKGGALARLLPVFRLGLGGRLASGRQWMSVQTLDDTVAAIRHMLTHPGLTGPVNVVCPAPLTNAQFTRELAAALGRPALFRVPAVALRVALGAMADETLLASQRAVPERLLEAGFRFRDPTAGEGLRRLLHR